MHVIGTAGHVDHGKSALVEAMTGTHPDRLKEEREREMTIDLGFAWVTLPNREEIGIVDVPGHRDFIENMLAGVGGIDAALFVIAADEGVMPQTREHLAILDILQIQGGVVALTKIDMVNDPDWLDLVEEDVRMALKGTVLEPAQIVRVSARRGDGIPELMLALANCLAGRPPRPDYGRPRLPIDRIFTIAGFGTVVTGTLTDGRLRAGEDIVILPNRIRGRIRGLQTHKKKEEFAVPGGRTAVNISGVTLDQIQRGDVVTHPNDYRPTSRLDVRFRLLPDAGRNLKHNVEVKFFIGAAEVVARLRLLASEELSPGQEGWLQLEPAQPVVAVRGDRYILRWPSPGMTLGGGVVVDPHPKGRHKRFSVETIERLNALARGTPPEVLLQAMLALGAASWKDVCARSNLDDVTLAQARQELKDAGQLVALEGNLENLQADNLVASKGYWDQLASRAIHELESYHQSFLLRPGMPREELKSRLKVPARLFNAALRRLVIENEIQESGPLVFRPGFAIRFTPQQKRKVDDLTALFEKHPYSPPSVKECRAEVGDEIYDAMIDLGLLVQVAPDVVFSVAGYQQMKSELHILFLEKGTLTAAQVRDYFNTSRRYTLALLEHLDSIGFTSREGDVRHLKI
jgi:selenocysteine-specific elongation factor